MTRFSLTLLLALAASSALAQPEPIPNAKPVRDPDCYRGRCWGMFIAVLPFHEPQAARSVGNFVRQRDGEEMQTHGATIGLHKPTESIGTFSWLYGLRVTSGRGSFPSESDPSRDHEVQVDLWDPYFGFTGRGEYEGLFLPYAAFEFIPLTFSSVRVGSKTYSGYGSAVAVGGGMKLYTRWPVTFDAGARYEGAFAWAPLATGTPARNLTYRSGKAIQPNHSGLQLRVGVDLYFR